MVFDETYFARGEPPPARLSVKGRSDITAVAADVDWWSESSGTVGNRPETFMLGMRNGGMTLFDTRETRMVRQPFAKASSYVTHLHAMRTSPRARRRVHRGRGPDAGGTYVVYEPPW